MATVIALAGNPNCGKTTLFNALTGSNQYVGNWPGVTVEAKNGLLAGRADVTIQDLPGIYSLSPYSLEEKVARNFLINQRPHAILNLVDGTNIERNLYLTTQLVELGLPMVVAVNMMDVVTHRGDTINFERLSKSLKCAVVGLSAQKGTGALRAAATALRAARQAREGEVPHVYTGSVEHALAHIEESIQGLVSAPSIRWCAIKVFERDAEAIAQMKIPQEILDHVEQHIRDCEAELEDDAESIIVGQRYAFVQHLVETCVERNQKRARALSRSAKIDRVLTNRILAIPFFVVALLCMYWLAVASNGPGQALTSWVNGTCVAKLAALCEKLCALWGMDATTLGYMLLKDGLVGGVCTVLSFVPVITIVFIFLGFLEDCGYMSRVAFIMDRLFRGFGLSGKSFIPMLVGKGCGVPAVMAARTIENKRDQRLTIILATFMPCGAKTILITLFTAAFFGDYWWMAAAMDLLGVIIIVLGGLALKKTSLFAGEAAPFVMELPAYHLPTLKGISFHTWERVKDYVWKAGIVIFPCCVVLTLMMGVNWRFEVVDASHVGESILASLGGLLAPLLAPLGFGTWQGAAATVSAEIAKEQACASLAMFAGDSSPEGLLALFHSFNSSHAHLAALSFLLFNLFISPCVGAIVTTFREMGSSKLGLFAVGFQIFVGWTLALNAYQWGVLITSGIWSGWLFFALALDALIVWFVIRKGHTP